MKSHRSPGADVPLGVHAVVAAEVHVGVIVRLFLERQDVPGSILVSLKVLKRWVRRQRTRVVTALTIRKSLSETERATCG